MRRNIKNKPSNSSVLLLAPDFHAFTKIHPLPEQQSSQAPGTGLIRQVDEELPQSPLFCELSDLSVQNELESTTCLQEEDRKMIATDALDLAAADQNINGSVSYSGLTPSVNSRHNEISSHHTLSDSPLPEKIISNNEPSIVTSISCQERNEIFQDHPSSSPEIQNNTLQAHDLLSLSDHSQISHQQILMATNRSSQHFVQSLPVGDNVSQCGMHGAYSILASRHSVESTTSRFQPIYPCFTRPVIPSQSVGYDSYSNEQVHDTSTHSESLYQQFLRRQHQHAITNIGPTLAAPVPVMSIPSMDQNNALMNGLYSSVNTPLTSPCTIQQNPGAYLHMTNNNLLLGSTPERTEVAISAIPTFLLDFGQRTAE